MSSLSYYLYISRQSWIIILLHKAISIRYSLAKIVRNPKLFCFLTGEEREREKWKRREHNKKNDYLIYFQIF